MGRQKGDLPLADKGKGKMVPEGRKLTMDGNVTRSGVLVVEENERSCRESAVLISDAVGGVSTASVAAYSADLEEHQGEIIEVDSTTDPSLPSQAKDPSLPPQATDPSLPPQATDPSLPPQATDPSLPPVADNLCPPPAEDPPRPPSDADTLFSKVSCSIVTVAAIGRGGVFKETRYGTGFILLSEEKYSLIFTSFHGEVQKRAKMEYYVYFEKGWIKTKAHVLLSDKNEKNKFLILIAETVKEYPTVIFSKDPAGYELIFTVGAIGGAKSNAKAVLDMLVGGLGIYKGMVTTPSCAALDPRRKRVHGSEAYFKFTCSIQDEIITLENVDNIKHTSNIILAAPVFHMNGEAIGILYSCGTWRDTKVGMHAKYVLSYIRRMCNMDDWKKQLKILADKWLKKIGGRST